MTRNFIEPLYIKIVANIHINIMSSFLTTEPISSPFRKTNFYGRRQARPLKDSQQELWDKYFPALLFQKEYCFDPQFWQSREVCLEIGMGNGEHLSQQALNNPHKAYIGCEPFVNGIASLLQKIEQYNLKNILIFPDSIHLILKELPDASLNEVFLLFADPWPKKRHHKRRFIQTETIKEIYRILKPQGIWKIATDHADYQQWVLDHFAQPEIQNLFVQKRPDIWQRPCMKEWPETRYEQKASQEARGSIFLEFKKVFSGKKPPI